jgi:hypothetical protein
MLRRVFLLSPASTNGRRAEILLREQATFDLAQRIRTEPGASLGEVFNFLSGLYFRGKLAYASRFADAEFDCVRVITTSRGLLPPSVPVNCEVLREFAATPIADEEPRYVEPLQRDARLLAEQLSPTGQAILLGSVATDKYVTILSAAFGNRLVFPEQFVGRGDMSRGGLLLRQVDEGQELAYIPVAGAVRHGVRPARLPRRQRS